jgi:D-alanine-D-alanine ligase-like ATP-grasp enzyme
MQEFKLKYGRLDFIEENDSFYFLECNPNGQFGWLDDFNTLYLHNKFVDAFLKN